MMRDENDPVAERFSQYLYVNRAWYPSPARELSALLTPVPLGDAVELRFGFFQSARPTQLRTLNIDRMHFHVLSTLSTPLFFFSCFTSK